MGRFFQMVFKSSLKTMLGRDGLILLVIVVAAIAVLSRAFYVQILQHDFLTHEGNKRQIRALEIPAPRGEVFDRHGELLALSTPISMIWADPKILSRHLDQLPALSRALGVSQSSLSLKVKSHANKRFIYLKRRALPKMAEKLAALDIPGVYIEDAFKRYYPAGILTAHVVGYTNIDEQGQDGVEYTYNDWLKGVPGKKKVIKDRAGHVIEFVQDIQPAKPGKPITLSLDKDIQYFAYRALKKAMIQHQASSASAVVLDAKTGEVLAMVSLPSFNPNDRSQMRGSSLRNRAIMDVMEPGSTLKPFIVAKGLDLGVIDEQTQINTAPGYFKVEDRVISDTHNHGMITPAQVIEFSSNIGASKIALMMTPEQEWSIYHEVGFGQDSGLFLPGEVPGRLKPFQAWGKIDQTSASYGYGLDVTLLQLAHAYLLFANHGRIQPVTLLKKEATEGARESGNDEVKQVVSVENADKVLHMMEAVTSRQGTAPKAAIDGYRVAGKTGTVHKTKAGGYEENEYLSLFVGIAPVSNPSMVMAVVVNQPSRGVYYGGLVAAPIFKEVMQEALRLRHVPFDLGTAQ